MHNVYTHNTQWAYGITCWEVFTAGSTPYPGLHPMTVIKQLDGGLRLEKPDNTACSEEMYVDTLVNRGFETDYIMDNGIIILLFPDFLKCSNAGNRIQSSVHHSQSW